MVRVPRRNSGRGPPRGLRVLVPGLSTPLTAVPGSVTGPADGPATYPARPPGRIFFFMGFLVFQRVSVSGRYDRGSAPHGSRPWRQPPSARGAAVVKGSQVSLSTLRT